VRTDQTLLERVATAKRNGTASFHDDAGTVFFVFTKQALEDLLAKIAQSTAENVADEIARLGTKQSRPTVQRVVQQLRAGPMEN